MDHVVGPSDDGQSLYESQMPTGPKRPPRSKNTARTSSRDDFRRELEEYKYYLKIDEDPDIQRPLR